MQVLYISYLRKKSCHIYKTYYERCSRSYGHKLDWHTDGCTDAWTKVISKYYPPPSTLGVKYLKYSKLQRLAISYFFFFFFFFFFFCILPKKLSGFISEFGSQCGVLHLQISLHGCRISKDL